MTQEKDDLRSRIKILIHALSPNTCQHRGSVLCADVHQRTKRRRSHCINALYSLKKFCLEIQVYCTHDSLAMSSLISDILPAPGSNISPPPPDLSFSSHHNSTKKSSPPRLSSHLDHHHHLHHYQTNEPSIERNADNIEDEPKQLKKREVYRFQTNWLVSSIAWSNEFSESFNLALSSYIQDYSNRVDLISLAKDFHDEEIKCISTFEHPYPATKILWIPRPPDNKTRLPQLLATTADYLRLWRIDNGDGLNREDATRSSLVGDSSCGQETEVKLESLLNTNKGVKHCAPLTSFDWNDIDPSIIVTASVDNTCAIWDIEAGKLVDKIGQQSNHSPTRDNSISCNLRSQLVAHNHEVYDVSFSRSGTGREVFVSAGGDGSVRLFDLRRLSTSTILYEVDQMTQQNGDNKALVRVCCNKQDANLVSSFSINSKDVLILDLRNPGRPIAALSSHTAELNSMSWAPHSAHHICTASNDHQALIWELSKLPNPVEEPLLAYRANGKINSISWSASHSDWIAIGFENYLELLRV